MKVILVPPVHFDVKESYNTRMRPDHPCGKPDKKRTFLQWARMASTAIHDLGITAHFIEPVEDLYDMTFACDPGFWVDDLFIPANFWASPRKPEVEHFVKWFRDREYMVKHLSPLAFFEGGDCVFVKNKIIIGYGENRTNLQGVEEVASIFKKSRVEKVVPIRRVTEEFYHLNSVLTYYPSADLIMYYPKAFEDSAGEQLAFNFPGTRIVPLSEATLFRKHPDFDGEYLYSYALNAVERNVKVLQPYCHEIQEKILRDHGLEVIVPEDGSSEFERSGGSYRCLMMIHNVTQ